METELDNKKRLKKLYQLAMKIMGGAVVLNPKNNGIIREAGGKMHMRMKAYKAAYGDFFEAFKSFDEAGSPKRIRCLKYLVLASMLMSKEGDIDVNPFEASEVKP
jgi:COP9 signalosome complex subunit 2